MLIRPKQIVQEGAGDEEVLTWADAPPAAMEKWEPDGLWGSNFASSESLGRSTTTSTTYQQKLRLTLPSTLPAGTYRLQWSCAIDNDEDTTATWVQIEQDDTTTIWEVEGNILYESSSRNLQHPLGGMADITLPAGSVYFDMDYRTAKATDTAAIIEARFLFWRLY